jgi:hypothetical protein
MFARDERSSAGTDTRRPVFRWGVKPLRDFHGPLAVSVSFSIDQDGIRERGLFTTFSNPRWCCVRPSALTWRSLFSIIRNLDQSVHKSSTLKRQMPFSRRCATPLFFSTTNFANFFQTCIFMYSILKTFVLDTILTRKYAQNRSVSRSW